MGIILIIVVAGLAVWLLTQHSETGTTRTNTVTPVPTETALELLRKRYARGEISRDEYQSRRRGLV